MTLYETLKKCEQSHEAEKKLERTLEELGGSVEDVIQEACMVADRLKTVQTILLIRGDYQRRGYYRLQDHWDDNKIQEYQRVLETMGLCKSGLHSSCLLPDIGVAGLPPWQTHRILDAIQGGICYKKKNDIYINPTTVRKRLRNIGIVTAVATSIGYGIGVIGAGVFGSVGLFYGYMFNSMPEQNPFAKVAWELEHRADWIT